MTAGRPESVTTHQVSDGSVEARDTNGASDPPNGTSRLQALRDDLVTLQARQEGGLADLNGTLEHIGTELSAVRVQLAALARAEPDSAANGASNSAGVETPAAAPEQQATDRRLERLERQVALLLRALDTLDELRAQTAVHTRAIARLADLLGEADRQRDATLAPVQQGLINLEAKQRGGARSRLIAYALLGLGTVPGLAALVWLIVQSGAI